MAERDVNVYDTCRCLIEVPGESRVGGDITLEGTVSCTPPADLRGRAVHVFDGDGVEVGQGEITEFDGAVNRTAGFVVKAPVTAGSHSWVAVVPGHPGNGDSWAETSSPFSLTVQPHPTGMSVWDVPSAIDPGERFAVKVGVRGSAVHEVVGRTVEIFDHEEVRVARGAVGDEPWPRTAALLFTEVELDAPAAVGRFVWKAVSPADATGLPHAASSCTFAITVVSPPESQVIVRAVDKEKGTPIEGLHVQMHPYRAVTDAHGVAVLGVANGAYELHVSGFQYMPFRTTIEVTEDVTAEAELAWEAPDQFVNA